MSFLFNKKHNTIFLKTEIVTCVSILDKSNDTVLVIYNYNSNYYSSDIECLLRNSISSYLNNNYEYYPNYKFINIGDIIKKISNELDINRYEDYISPFIDYYSPNIKFGFNYLHTDSNLMYNFYETVPFSLLYTSTEIIKIILEKLVFLFKEFDNTSFSSIADLRTEFNKLDNDIFYKATNDINCISISLYNLKIFNKNFTEIEFWKLYETIDRDEEYFNFVKLITVSNCNIKLKSNLNYDVLPKVNSESFSLETAIPLLTNSYIKCDGNLYPSASKTGSPIRYSYYTAVGSIFDGTKLLALYYIALKNKNKLKTFINELEKNILKK